MWSAQLGLDDSHDAIQAVTLLVWAFVDKMFLKAEGL